MFHEVFLKIFEALLQRYTSDRISRANFFTAFNLNYGPGNTKMKSIHVNLVNDKFRFRNRFPEALTAMKMLLLFFKILVAGFVNAFIRTDKQCAISK